MTVYVDKPLDWGKGTVKGAPRVRFWCHMMCDNEQELHDMADKIGMRRSWFQGPPEHRLFHYDITMTKRQMALNLGAEEMPTDIEWCLAFFKRIRVASLRQPES